MQRVEDEDYEEEEVDIVDESGNVLDKRDRKRTQITSTQEKLLAKSKQLNRNRQTLDIDNSGLNQNEDGASSYNNSEFPRNQA
jgi:predicted  nucleic acid-binding Zn-ribbon protein